MLSLENTASRMSHLARQEIYFDRQFGLDETLAGHRARDRRTTCSAWPRICSRTARWRATVLGAVNGLEIPTRATATWLRCLGSTMIPRYTHPEMGAHLERPAPLRNLAARSRLAAAEAMAARRHRAAPRRRATSAREARFDIARIEEIEQITQHDVIAFTTAVAEHVGPSARWLHFGLTSSDVIDTAQALQMREACDLILDGPRRAAGGGPRRAPTSTGARR